MFKFTITNLIESAFANAHFDMLLDEFYISAFAGLDLGLDPLHLVAESPYEAFAYEDKYADYLTSEAADAFPTDVPVFVLIDPDEPVH